MRGFGPPAANKKQSLSEQTNARTVPNTFLDTFLKADFEAASGDSRVSCRFTPYVEAMVFSKLTENLYALSTAGATPCNH